MGALERLLSPSIILGSIEQSCDLERHKFFRAEDRKIYPRSTTMWLDSSSRSKTVRKAGIGRMARSKVISRVKTAVEESRRRRGSFLRELEVQGEVRISPVSIVSHVGRWGDPMHRATTDRRHSGSRTQGSVASDDSRHLSATWVADGRSVRDRHWRHDTLYRSVVWPLSLISITNNMIISYFSLLLFLLCEGKRKGEVISNVT
ncbi:PREDICTED: uncharacterized protein LOC106745321 [Dinoponera quadriceps]|uniref:Uncharacterized protein LOC106745321 n=1 Tax=Dinoponera quadriceps TaxID=609295 RepID=A0A6P3XD16_DINQU|nr:PREDICTED: uncharacterized protein LOC106745321 [Dinoponera quadriceps]